MDIPAMDASAIIEDLTPIPGIVPADLCRQFSILPVSVDNLTICVLAPQAPPRKVLGDLSFQLGKQVSVRVIDPKRFRVLAEGFEDAESHPAKKSDLEAPQSSNRAVQGERRSPSGWTDKVGSRVGGSIVEYVNTMLFQAITDRASDIHIESYEDRFRIRYRIDGILQERPTLGKEYGRSLISRLKIMGDLDIAEKRRPQDGRIRFSMGERPVDIRVSTLPTIFGEKIVLRILDKAHVELDLTKLGFEKEDLDRFRQTLRLPHGMILVTGPTGSGKTTTLYAGLQEINDSSINITTIEDPIEYNLTGINQTHVKKDIGLTFAASLRSILRQDPNVIMVGEIRDTETAEIAIRAALTGHLVLSTLHTNDAPSAITRLIDMGIEHFLVAASVRMIIAQRLVRRLCQECASATHPTESEITDLHLDPTATVFRPVGCTVCSRLGYKGRVAVYEVLPITGTISDRIAKGLTTTELRSLSIQGGMKVLRDAALLKVSRGETSLEEVRRETIAN